jgi:hypothetical protein
MYAPPSPAEIVHTGVAVSGSGSSAMTNVPSASAYTSAPIAWAISVTAAHGSPSTSKVRGPIAASTAVETTAASGMLRWMRAVMAPTAVPDAR